MRAICQCGVSEKISKRPGNFMDERIAKLIAENDLDDAPIMEWSKTGAPITVVI